MNILLIKSFFAILISFLITFYLIPVLLTLAHRIKFLDIPDGTIKQQSAPVPYCGGVAVYVGFLFSLALVLPFQNALISFLIGITLLLFIGLMDDFFVLQPYQKFFGQIMSALCFLKAGFYLKEHFFSSGELVSIVLSLFWILTVINAFNLVDVMDGLTAVISLVASCGFIAIALTVNNGGLVLLFCALIGSLVAFLLFNRPPAQMYLGDAGSLFLGGFFAAAPFLFPWGMFTPYGFLTPVILLVIPLLEVATLILIRWYKKIPFYRGSPDHFSHYLLRNRWSKQGILGYVALLGSIGVLVSYEFFVGNLSLLQIIQVGAVFLIFWYLILFWKD
ncbi:hypothetical protein CVU75_01645 [Candidatus Dependentiae bacterium HGW-Dependentiae-1]|nr:MAG: hypothetical protein CVU75_01645 [Candidatus Dependentiae bacterium HGW-Dependentiae-1]